MHVVDVEVVGLQAFEAFVDRAQDRLARESLLIGRVAHLVEDLTGEDDLVTSALERVAEQGLRHSSVVHVGGVEEVDSGIEASADDLVRTRLVKRLAERHGSKTEAGNGEVGVVQRAAFHRSIIVLGILKSGDKWALSRGTRINFPVYPVPSALDIVALFPHRSAQPKRATEP